MSYNKDNDPRTNPQINGNVVSGVVIGISALAMLPFLIAGFYLIVSGIGDLQAGYGFGMPKVIFGAIWNLILVFIFIYMFRTMKKNVQTVTDTAMKQSNAPINKDPRFAGSEVKNAVSSDDGGYQAPEYIDPRNDPRFDYEWMKHDDCEADHEDDEDSVMKGYE